MFQSPPTRYSHYSEGTPLPMAKPLVEPVWPREYYVDQGETSNIKKKHYGNHILLGSQYIYIIIYICMYGTHILNSQKKHTYRIKTNKLAKGCEEPIK